MTNPALIAHTLVYTAILLAVTRMVYLLFEWFFIALGRRYVFWKINRDFRKARKQYDEPRLSYHPEPILSHPTKGLAETAMSEADYRPFMNDAAEYQTETGSSKSAA